MAMLRIGLPILLGIIAALLNFMILRSQTATLELTVVRRDIPVDTELTEDMLEPLPVRAERGLFKSAVRYSERGVSLLGRRVARPLAAGEVVMYVDVHNMDEENITAELKPGESTLTFAVKPSRVARELRPGNSVGVLVQPPTILRESGKNPARAPASLPGTPRILGPFRLISLSPVSSTSGGIGAEGRVVTVAVVRSPEGQLEPNAAALVEAISGTGASYSRGESNVIALEYYQQAR